MDKSESKLMPCAHLVRTTDGKTTQCDVCGAVGDVINPNWEPRWRDAPASADSQEREAELPPLPLPEDGTKFGMPRFYTSDDMRNYARAALAAPKQTELTDAQILQIAADTGLKIRTGQGAIRFARAVLAAAITEQKEGGGK